MDEATPTKMSQLREGSFGRLASQDVGIPTYLRAVRTPEGPEGVANEPPTSRSDMPTIKKMNRQNFSDVQILTKLG